jgi:hypothetical protein
MMARRAYHTLDLVLANIDESRWGNDIRCEVVNHFVRGTIEETIPNLFGFWLYPRISAQATLSIYSNMVEVGLK